MLDYIELQVVFTDDGKRKGGSVKASVSKSISLESVGGFGDIEIFGEAYGEDAEEAYLELKRMFSGYPSIIWNYDDYTYHKINEEVRSYKNTRHLFY